MQNVCNSVITFQNSSKKHDLNILSNIPAANPVLVFGIVIKRAVKSLGKVFEL